MKPVPITFSANPLDRAAHLRRDEAWLAARAADAASRYLFMSELKALILPGERPAIAWQPAARAGNGKDGIFLGTMDGIAHFAIDMTGETVPDQAGKWIDVRTIAPQLPPPEAAILAQARSLIDWHARHGFCAVCGSPSRPVQGGHARRCANEACDAEHFPRTDPVVIMLVVRGDQCLLGRQSRFQPGVYSALAGFIEQGETIEEAVRREVAEEAGLTVRAVRYLASQPWPFPSSLMIGCLAETADERIRMDAEELEDARWFPRAEVAAMAEASLDPNASPRLPPPLAIAHHLARVWLAGG